MSTEIFEAYLKEFSLYRPKEYKIVVIECRFPFHKKNIAVPDNIHLLRIPPYSPELNPCEQVWQYIKNRFKNQRFKTKESLRQWLHEMVCEMKAETIKSITGNHHYLDALITTFEI
ncbi:transposase [Gelidibacter salicanalis]|uniref:transposase n=1 Tax=Gelidibacter salicanalis TaxID=291193 RepID=UPI0027DBD28A|nr:transposase [Gelidibacter salicanalis]